MKKTLLAIAFFLLIKINAQCQTMWQGFPITVNVVNVNATDSYLTYSVFDTLIGATVMDSTPVYSDEIYYNNAGSLLGYNVNYSDYSHYIFYNHNTHLFKKDSVYLPINFFWGPVDCYGPPTISGNYFVVYFCGDVYENLDIIAYADIVNDSIRFYIYSCDNEFGCWGIIDGGYFITKENGNTTLELPGYFDAGTVQPGLLGGCYAYSDIGDFGYGYHIKDGIIDITTIDYWGDSTVKYCSNDGCGGITLLNPTIYGGRNGIVYYCDSTLMHIACDDAPIDQWVQFDFSVAYDTLNSEIKFKDRVFAFAANKNSQSNVYVAAYNLTLHAWAVDSVLSNGVDSLVINNGTVTWNDLSGTPYMRGYSAISGWGAFTTPLQIDFSVENMQSPTNGNLVYVRNYTIGSDQTIFDFGDGYITPKKSESHLYRNPDGSYRTSSSSFNYNICASANGQSVCKPVSFILNTQNVAQTYSPVNIRYGNTAGKFLLDNPTNKTLLVTIYNALGQTVNSFLAKQTVTPFNLLTEATGVYMLEVISTDGAVQQCVKLVNY